MNGPPPQTVRYTRTQSESPHGWQVIPLLYAFTGLLLAMVASTATGQALSTSTYFRPRPAMAAAPVPDGDSKARRLHVSLYASQWAEINLPSLPARIVTADIPLRESYFVGLGAAWVIAPNFEVPLGLFSMTGVDFELEGQLVQHFGFQRHMEGTFAFVLRTGDLNLVDLLQLNFAVGEGLSLAFANPRYEKGPDGRRAKDSRRFQNHLLFELEFTSPKVPFVHAVVRLHHRSGIYGLISPQKTGSNFIGAGLRFDHP